MKEKLLKILLLVLLIALRIQIVSATVFSDFSFIIPEANAANVNSEAFWRFLQNNNNSGLELKVKEFNGNIVLPGSNQNIKIFLSRLKNLFEETDSKVIPIFLEYDGNVTVLDSIINNSGISSQIFYLPQGETWPTTEYLIQAKRRIIFFIKGNHTGESRIMHSTKNYVLRISANEIAVNTGIYNAAPRVNMELFMIDELDKLPTKSPPSNLSRAMMPDYINFLLENWTRFGKRPNFLFIGNDYANFSFLIDQLNSFTWINGSVKIAGKTMEKVYWKNPDVSITGGKFSFPYRGGEEIILSPFVPGYKMTPQQVVVTGEMDVPESYTIIASPMNLSDDITGSFSFDDLIMNALEPEKIYNGENYSFSQDIERGSVLRLPENAIVNLGNPEHFGLRNSSFTVSCFVKFTEILEFGDNAVLGNYESEYRRGLHLIIRSGHPYFGLYSNDYISEEKLQPNIWYHLAWRYIIETGEQTIFLNGKNIGGSDGHPPFSGTGDIHLGSALSRGASLRGYIDDLNFWSRPLGIEEINRLALNENIVISKPKKDTSIIQKSPLKLFAVTIFLVFIAVLLFFLLRKKSKKINRNIVQPQLDSSINSINLFGEFKAFNKEGKEITELFTPKIKELFLYILLYTIKNGNGAKIKELNEHLWPGLTNNKVSNNRAVTLNKLRKILNQIEGIEITVQNNYILANISSSFFCDFYEAFQLCQLTGELSKQQLITFFHLVKDGRFLKDSNWPWLDEMRGFTGSQVIDNLLKLASIYKKEKNLKKIDAIARRILDYDDLNEEAIYLQIWGLQQTNNIHLAKFNFNNFRSKYKENMGEEYPMDFDHFMNHFSLEL